MQSQNIEFIRVTGAKNIPYDVLVCATNNFDEKEKLGKGGFGAVFKGYLKDLDIFVAVKRVSESSIQGIKEYAAEVMILSQLRHKNLVQLIDFNPMLGDFGLAQLQDHDGLSQTLQGGSHGYIAPECLDTGKWNKESDVFSFGVVALEIACGRKPFVPREDGSQVHIVTWVWEYYGSGKLLKAADQKLHGDFTRNRWNV
ncbi:hypothetical protein GH714_000524 [Hevea brasiliensis]|uniref:Protein kinase domain-containing protein n=1 Tax=Hevea brasiliensis TaxID=3981 RepID=A0A6A6N871_HEVBR|nr:hypothetical protein GH714_000524 [Hevea brasiliensis]